VDNARRIAAAAAADIPYFVANLYPQPGMRADALRLRYTVDRCWWKSALQRIDRPGLNTQPDEDALEGERLLLAVAHAPCEGAQDCPTGCGVSS
jgi:hypothetical protein